MVVNCVELGDTAHCQIEVDLLRHAVIRPGRARQLVDLLERETRAPVWVAQVDPLGAGPIRLAGRGRLVALSIDEPEQLPPELSAGPRVGRVEHDLSQSRGRYVGHGRTVPTMMTRCL